MNIIGIAGVATSGKDLLCSLLSSELRDLGFEPRRFALADRLKAQIAPFLSSELGIDIFNCSPSEKELIRPLLVAFGKAKRVQSNGRYWTSLLSEEIKTSNCDFAIVTDIRYQEYEEDECSWLKKQGGKLIHLTRFEEGRRVLPPNEDESRNDPILESLADVRVAWNTDLEEAKRWANEISNLILSWKTY